MIRFIATGLVVAGTLVSAFDLNSDYQLSGYFGNRPAIRQWDARSEFGLRLTRPVMKGFSVEGELGFSNASRRYTSGSDDLVMANVHAIQYANFVDLKPYMLMGLGLKTGHVTTMGPSFGVGLYIPVKQMAVRLEGRNTYFFEQEHLGREQSKQGLLYSIALSIPIRHSKATLPDSDGKSYRIRK